MPISAGVPAPEFTLQDDTETTRSLSDYRGQSLVLYFYPKDDTPGCTTEACNFRDDYSAYQQAGVTILGISPDTPKSHAKFKAKFGLPFPLLADIDHKVCELYGVWGLKSSWAGNTTASIAPRSSSTHKARSPASSRMSSRPSTAPRCWRRCRGIK